MSQLPVVKSTTSVLYLSKRSPYTQIALGAGGGLVTGYAIFKISKVLAIFTGGAMLVVQLAVEADFIRIESNNSLIKKVLQGDIDTEALLRVRKPSDLLQLTFVQKIRNVVSCSLRLYTSFLAGFFLGFGIA